MKADKVFVNGTIYTMDPKNPKAEAVATFGKMILGVGQKSDMATLIGPDTKVIDLGGRTMIPGINDSHSHIIMYGINLTLVDLDPSKCPDIATMKKMVAERAALLGPGKWVQGWGWDESRMSDGRMPNVDDMTEACPNNPVTLTRGCVHMILTNKMGLELAGITNDTPDPEGGKIVRDEHGVATGLMQDNAQNYIKDIVPAYTKDQMVNAIELSNKNYNERGITSSCDAGTLISVEGENEAWYEAWSTGRMSVRNTTLMVDKSATKIKNLGMGSNFGDDMLRFGCVKFFMDGSLGGATACMKKAYKSDPTNFGLAYLEQDELNAKIKEVHDLGYQISVHAIGDESIDRVITAIENALQDNPRKDHRHRIEHNSYCTNDLLEREKKAGINISVNPDFLYFFGIAHLKHIGTKVYQEFAAKTALKMGIPVAIGSDCPVLVPDPCYGLYAITQRKAIDGSDLGVDECITMAQALHAYTSAGAYMTFEENIKGSIERGKLADLTVLNCDPFTLEGEEILKFGAEMTVLGGKIVYEK